MLLSISLTCYVLGFFMLKHAEGSFSSWRERNKVPANLEAKRRYKFSPEYIRFLIKIMNDIQAYVGEHMWISSIYFGKKNIRIAGSSYSLSEVYTFVNKLQDSAEVSFTRPVLDIRDAKQRLRYSHGAKKMREALAKLSEGGSSDLPDESVNPETKLINFNFSSAYKNAK